MKKFLLTLGAMGAIAAPIVTVVACGSSTSKYDFKKDLAKFNMDYVSTQAKADLSKAVGTKKVGDAITASDLSVTLPTAFETGVTAAYKVNTAYESSAGTMMVTVTLTHGKDMATKDFTVYAKDGNYSYTNLLDKIKDINSTKSKASAPTKSEGDTVTVKDLGIDISGWDIPQDVTPTMTVITQAIQPGDAKAYIKVKLVRNGMTGQTGNEKAITVTFAA